MSARKFETVNSTEYVYVGVSVCVCVVVCSAKRDKGAAKQAASSPCAGSCTWTVVKAGAGF